MGNREGLQKAGGTHHAPQITSLLEGNFDLIRPRYARPPSPEGKAKQVCFGPTLSRTPPQEGGRLSLPQEKRQACATRELCERRPTPRETSRRVHRFEPKLTHQTPRPRTTAARPMSGRTLNPKSRAHIHTPTTAALPSRTRAQPQKNQTTQSREWVKGRRPLRVEGSALPAGGRSSAASPPHYERSNPHVHLLPLPPWSA